MASNPLTISVAGQAHISLAQARSIAIHTVNGSIASQELETEPGCSGLRYSFDVRTASGVREVGVDAKTGAVLENSIDNVSAGGGEQGESSKETGDALGSEAGEGA